VNRLTFRKELVSYIFSNILFLGTQSQGYPLLQHERHRTYATPPTTSDPARRAGQRTPRGRERHCTPVRPDPRKRTSGPYLRVRSLQVSPNSSRVPEREGPWCVQGSGANACAGLASASHSCGDPLLVAHDISC
jgi:hypothetical protein